jgi:hypothetical protein
VTHHIVDILVEFDEDGVGRIAFHQDARSPFDRGREIEIDVGVEEGDAFHVVRQKDPLLTEGDEVGSLGGDGSEK